MRAIPKNSLPIGYDVHWVFNGRGKEITLPVRVRNYRAEEAYIRFEFENYTTKFIPWASLESVTLTAIFSTEAA